MPTLLFCILRTDARDGDSFVHGPFPDRDKARVFAANEADMELAELRHLDGDTPWELDANETGDGIFLLADEDEVVFEWQVLELIPEPCNCDPELPSQLCKRYCTGECPGYPEDAS